MNKRQKKKNAKKISDKANKTNPFVILRDFINKNLHITARDLTTSDEIH